MTADLHARLVTALNEEQARAEAVDDAWHLYLTGGVRASAWHGFKDYIAWQDPARTLARVAADRRVLERHRMATTSVQDPGAWCVQCSTGGVGEVVIATIYPCDDTRDLAARYGIEVEP